MERLLILVVEAVDEEGGVVVVEVEAKVVVVVAVVGADVINLRHHVPISSSHLSKCVIDVASAPSVFVAGP